MEIRRLQFELKDPTIEGTNLLLRFSQRKKPFERLLSVTDNVGNSFAHVDAGLWVALKVRGGATIINIDVVGGKGHVNMEIVQTEN
jgi:hypothetical protein